MRLNLGCGADIRTGYVNIDLNAVNAPPELFTQGDVTNLDWVCGDGTVDEILALDILAFFENQQLPEVLSHWWQKLADGGRMLIGIIDGRVAAKAFYMGQISREQYVAITMGDMSQPRRLIVDFVALESLLNQLGAQIESKSFEGMTLRLDVRKKS